MRRIVYSSLGCVLWRVVAGVIGVALLLASCGVTGSTTSAHSSSPKTHSTLPLALSSPSGSHGTDGGSRSNASPSSAPSCGTNQLRGAYQWSLTSRGATTSWFSLTNISAGECTLVGFPGFQPLGTGGSSVSVKVNRQKTGWSSFSGGTISIAPSLVTLTPNASVQFETSYSSTCAGGSSSSCRPVQEVRLWPPNQTQSLVIPLPSGAQLSSSSTGSLAVAVSPVMLVNYAMCGSSQLSVAMMKSSQQINLVYETFGLSNFGTSPCSLVGYPGFQPLTADGQPIPSKVVRTTSPGSTFLGRLTGGITATPQFTVVNPGQTVYFQVAYSDSCPGSPSPGSVCASARSVQVWPPNQRISLSISLPGSLTEFSDQTSPIRIDVSPVYSS
jgi:hypothetical protein